MFTGDSVGMDVNAEGFEPGRSLNTRMDKVGADYMTTLGISRISGRDFTKEDIYGSSRVVIVNEAFAEQFELGRDAVGKYVGFPMDFNPNVEIIGLANNSKYVHPSGNPQPFIFIPYRQFELLQTGNLIFYIKSTLPPSGITPQIQSIVTRLDPTLPIENMSMLTHAVRDSTFGIRFQAIFAISGACLAILLTAVGLYGIFAYDVSLRRREIGLRMAFGATRLRLCLMFLRRAALISLAGGVIGIVLSVYAGRIIQSMLYKFDGFDTGVFFGAMALLFVIMATAVLIPVSRAVMIEPLEALRDE